MKIQIEILENLLDKGLTNKEIAEILNTSRSSVVRIKSKYKLKSKYNELKREKKICLQCNKEFDCLISDERKFCSMSCSRTLKSVIRNMKRSVGSSPTFGTKWRGLEERELSHKEF